MNTANILVSVDGLIICGLPIARHQYPQLQAAVEAELSRLLSMHGIAQQWMQGGSTRFISGDNIQLTSVIDPSCLGQQIAAATFHVLGEETK